MNWWKALFTHKFILPVSLKLTIKVWHCTNGDGACDG